MADLDGGFFLIEKGIGGNEQQSGLMNATLQRVGPFDISVAMFVEPPQHVIDQGEDAVAAWLSFLMGGCHSDAIKHGGAVRFHVQIGPAED